MSWGQGKSEDLHVPRAVWHLAYLRSVVLWLRKVKTALPRLRLCAGRGARSSCKASGRGRMHAARFMRD